MRARIHRLARVLAIALGMAVLASLSCAAQSSSPAAPTAPVSGVAPASPANAPNSDVATQGEAAPGAAPPGDSQSHDPVYRSGKGDIVPQGSSIPGLGGVPGMLNGPAYVEVGGDDSHLSGPDAAPGSSWNDLYVRGALSSTKNVINYEFTHETRFNDSGWYYGAGWTRTLSQSLYAELAAGSSIGGQTIPRLRLDAIAHLKTLARKQLVLGVGVGYDKSKTVNSATRGQLSGTYYFDRFPVIAEAGMTLTHANPGSILARAQWLGVTEGHDKEHYVSFRYEFGREGYELIETSPNTVPAAVFNFPISNYSVNWRQWIGLNWGVNVSFEHEGNPNYHRNGGLIGFFLDF
ncbi:MAG TPA: YaiO family outer membrane beta-barrel protein [Terriglobales bacterium]|nr:YaiO family outer membrane beta-barrel protein [Terriglobales bacterium]